MQAHNDWVRDSGDSTHRLKYTLSSEDLVLDAGGYKGDFAARIYDLYKPHIHVFEPVNKFYKNLENRFQTIDKIVVKKCGLGKETKPVGVHLDNDSTTLIECSDFIETTIIKDIKEVLEDLGTPEIALFKINIEGGEYDLLDRLIETGLINNIENLQIQFHSWYPNAEFRRLEIIKLLKKTHICRYNYPFVWEGWSRVK